MKKLSYFRVTLLCLVISTEIVVGNSKLLKRKRDVKQSNDQLEKDESIPPLPILPPPGFPYEVRPVSMQPPFIPPDVPGVPIQPGIQVPPFEYVDYQNRKFLAALNNLFTALQYENSLWHKLFEEKFETLDKTLQQLILTAEREKLTTLETQQLGLVPWYEMYRYSANREDHFYTINATYKDELLSYGYIYVGIPVYMMTECSSCADKVRVYGYFDYAGENNWYTTNANEIGHDMAPQDQHYCCQQKTYCVKEKGQCSATVPIQRYQLINGGTKKDDYYVVGDVREIEGYRFKETMCYGWPTSDDKPIAKPKLKSAVGNPDTLVYEVKTETSNTTDESENIDAEIFIQLYGTEGETIPISLENVDFDDGKTYVEHFKKGAVASFSVKEPDVGKIIVLRLFTKGTINGWFCEGVTIDVPEKAESYYFFVNKKIDNEGLEVSGHKM